MSTAAITIHDPDRRIDFDVVVSYRYAAGEAPSRLDPGAKPCVDIGSVRVMRVVVEIGSAQIWIDRSRIRPIDLPAIHAELLRRYETEIVAGILESLGVEVG